MKCKNLFLVFAISLGFTNQSKAENYSLCVNSALETAIARGAPKIEAYNSVSGLFEPDDEIIALSKIQPESKLPVWAYLWTLLDDVKIQDGRNSFSQYSQFLENQSQKTGVDGATIAGIWGIETNFGKIIGKRKVINALATMACGANSKRAAFFKNELIAAIRIEAKGHVTHEEFTGSWAGAFGQTQFMPTTFWSIAVDGNNDGKINLISQTEDALASTANYLKRAGWKPNETWGFEVEIPKGVKFVSSQKSKKPLSYWLAKGIKPINSSENLNPKILYGLILPAGNSGPAFLVGKNFDAVFSYNGAISYALAVNLLADAIKQKPIMVGKWPTQDAQITRAQKIEIQINLKKLGYDIGEIDGLIGMKAQKAIKDLYSKNNRIFDGVIGFDLYRTIKSLSSNMN